MDFHCRSRGHKVKKEEGIPCKKCDYIAENKDDSWVHKKVHIPPEKLFECGDCVWCVIIIIIIIIIINVVIFVFIKVRRQTGQPQIPHPLSGQTHTLTPPL